MIMVTMRFDSRDLRPVNIQSPTAPTLELGAHYLRQVLFSSVRRKDREVTLSLDDDSTAASGHARLGHSSRHPSVNRTYLSGEKTITGRFSCGGTSCIVRYPTTGSYPTAMNETLILETTDGPADRPALRIVGLTTGLLRMHFSPESGSVRLTWFTPTAVPRLSRRE
ncbi:hypothetical protein BD413DRAFT_63437 [Trametes elegans]|nr:hypothetical protein BD413DRAFT_63437 [Trametes elegans]